MGFNLVEVHLPTGGRSFDGINILPQEYHGSVKMFTAAGLPLNNIVVVTYSHQSRDDFQRQAEKSGHYNVTYTGTYGELPPENITELLAGSNNVWNLIITGRYWGSCHLSAFYYLLEAIKERKPQQTNFHFIKTLIDGINRDEVLDSLNEGHNTYISSAAHTGGIVRVFDDNRLKHTRVKDYKTTFDKDSGEWIQVPALPNTLTKIDLFFWSNLATMMQAVKENHIAM